MNKKQKVILIGRHAPEGLPTEYEVVEQRNIMFPATSEECKDVLQKLFSEAMKAEASVLLQNTPGQVAVALEKIGVEYFAYNTPKAGFYDLPPCGAIISKPVVAGTGASETFWVNDPTNEYEVVRALEFANPNAKVEVVQRRGHFQCRIILDPIRKFAFERIERIEWGIY